MKSANIGMIMMLPSFVEERGLCLVRFACSLLALFVDRKLMETAMRALMIVPANAFPWT